MKDQNPLESKLYIFYYKPGKIFRSDGFYCPVYCGSDDSLIGAEFISDHTGDTIADKNAFFSELTGTYWVWKNTSQHITGTCHYRRYFTLAPEPLWNKIYCFIKAPLSPIRAQNPLIYTKNLGKGLKSIISRMQIETILEEYDAVLPVARKFKYSVRRHYEKYHNLRDLETLREIMEEKCPEYLDAFEQVMEGNSLYANNMFVMKSPLYGEFMTWWFGLLFEFEKRVDLASYGGYQQRILGFMAERCLTIWFAKHQPKVKELQVLYFKGLKFELG